MEEDFKYNMQPLGEFLRKRRADKGYTLKQVAADLNISVSYLHDIEKGITQRPKYNLLQLISAYYGLNEDDVIIKAGRVPRDVFYKLIHNPEIIDVIRQREV